MGLTVTRTAGPSEADLQRVARKLYVESDLIAPTWEQLGEATKSTWIERAKRALAGDKQWWTLRRQRSKP